VRRRDQRLPREPQTATAPVRGPPNAPPRLRSGWQRGYWLVPDAWQFCRIGQSSMHAGPSATCGSGNERTHVRTSQGSAHIAYKHSSRNRPAGKSPASSTIQLMAGCFATGNRIPPTSAHVVCPLLTGQRQHRHTHWRGSAQSRQVARLDRLDRRCGDIRRDIFDRHPGRLYRERRASER